MCIEIYVICCVGILINFTKHNNTEKSTRFSPLTEINSMAYILKIESINCRLLAVVVNAEEKTVSKYVFKQTKLFTTTTISSLKPLKL